MDNVGDHTRRSGVELIAEYLPAWQTARAPTVTALAVLWTMFREYKASHGPEDARSFREQAAEAGRSWIEYRGGSVPA